MGSRFTISCVYSHCLKYLKYFLLFFQSDDSVECQGEKGLNPPSEIDNPGDNKLVKPAIISPADIYEKFAKISKDTDERPLKPILKEKRLPSENIKLKSILKTSPEHKPYAPDNGVIEKALEEPKSILKTGQDVSGNILFHFVMHIIKSSNNVSIQNYPQNSDRLQLWFQSP